MSRAGRQTFVYDHPPAIAARTSIVGPKEGRGPLRDWFDEILPDDLLGQKSWELAESEMARRAMERTLDKAGLSPARAQALLSGDLNNQIIASSFAARALGIPFLGLYGACSTFVQALVVGSALISGGDLDNALCCASSHFCTAERQFRAPVELGNQRPPQASWTTTACGCALLKGDAKSAISVRAGTIGRVIDLGVHDSNHMGAAMAPAVCACLEAHLSDLNADFNDYDLIVTGDLGWIGRNLLLELLRRDGVLVPEEKLVDCGASMFYQEQDTHAGGSGCGCVASVGCGWIMGRMERGELRRVLLSGSGAMLNSISCQQGESIPGIAYAVALESAR
ncbi:MAG: stage V sporulation protein AD [Candidatus Faecivicinus sp.]|nr:stage V sporulation protein AD [Candidatus Faecivicinus sp.]